MSQYRWEKNNSERRNQRHRADMASLLQPDRVIYLVRGEKKIRAPLSQLYFCRYCSELRSLECVSHEVSISGCCFLSPHKKNSTAQDGCLRPGELYRLECHVPTYFSGYPEARLAASRVNHAYCWNLWIPLVGPGVCILMGVH